MILGDHDDPVVTWQHAERYLGAHTRTYSSYAADLDISARYHPQLGTDSFHLDTFVVPDHHGDYLTAAPSPLHAIYRQPGGFLLPVHPDTLTHPALHRAHLLRHLPAGPRLTAVPSANARTVFITEVDGAPVTPHFLKLHYPRRLSRFTRRLRRPIIGLQLWVSTELTKAGLPHLPEVGGAVLGDHPTEAWGYLIREAGATPATPYTVPLFALYGDDHRHPGHPTLIQQLIARGDEPPHEYAARRIIAPMVDLWASTLLRTGCVAEMHGQNTLFRFATDPTDTAIIYRDCGVYVDPTIRHQRGLDNPLPGVNVLGRDVTTPREQVFSLAYDSFMGHHALSYLARLLATHYGTTEETLHRAARDTYARHTADQNPLPDTVYYYDGDLHPDGAWHLIDTGARPHWR